MFVNFFFLPRRVITLHYKYVFSNTKNDKNLASLSFFFKEWKKKRNEREFWNVEEKQAREGSRISLAFTSHLVSEREKLLSSAPGGQIFWSGFFYRWRTQARGNAVVAAGEKL